MTTHEENIAKVREACIKANPSILDLVFGCRFVWDNPYTSKKEVYIVTAIERFPKNKFTAMAVADFNKAGRSIEDPYKFDDRILDKPFEIIGRPIRLADVLLAMWKNGKCIPSDFLDFSALIPSVNFDLEGGIKRWDLSNDDLTKQSPETVAFIRSILGL